ncbi:MAG: CHAT domain-containing protein [Planctomycetota bacterium]
MNMQPPPEVPASIETLSRALARNDVDAIRQAIAQLDSAGAELLAERIGATAVRSATRRARRNRASARRALGGRVVVINGIMGARLDVVDASGDVDRVWVNYWRLITGRIADLELDPAGQQKDARTRVQVAGLFPEYVPLVLELDKQWDVLPFAFDWRLDLDLSADKLAQAIRDWARNEPVHIVAHSMGGLVARRFIAKHADVWQAMRDPNGMRRGGRLVMLGTPNQGSFAVPQVFTGVESVVRKLATADLWHSRKKLLKILATFPGCYQMMPSPELQVADDRQRLFTRETWGAFGVQQPHLDRARTVQRELRVVRDPERLIYVAGFNRETPYRIRVAANGKFEYQMTRSGDGRVPHELGLLPGVPTFYIDEDHGALPGNAAVLEGISELLLSGTTGSLESTLPATRGAADKKWLSGDTADSADRELDEILAGSARAGAKKRATRTRTQKPLAAATASRAEALILSGFVQSPAALESAAPIETVAAKTPAPRPHRKPFTLDVEVVCGGITEVAGDVYAAGHYIGVLPQFAEAALDAVVSRKQAPEHERVLHNLTLHGVLRGDLGEITFYPWATKPQRLVAIAGMGHPGTFGPTELRRLSRNLAIAVASNPRVHTVCTVLIGAGVGNMEVTDAVHGMLFGAGDALGHHALVSAVKRLIFVEKKPARAEEIHAAIARLAQNDDLRRAIALRLTGPVRFMASAERDESEGRALAFTAIARAAAAKPGTPRHRAAQKILTAIPGARLTPKDLGRALTKLTQSTSPTAERQLVERLAVAIDNVLRGEGRADAARAPARPATRISCLKVEDELRIAALSDSAVVSERSLRFDMKLLADLIRQTTDPELDAVARLSRMTARLLVPHDFVRFLREAPAVIFELNRESAAVHWEFLEVERDGGAALRPVGVAVPVARQLRTAYSPAPVIPRTADRPLRALVIGDPGDPKLGDDLPGARREALAVMKQLLAANVEVEARIGCTTESRRGELRGIRPADRFEVLELLLSGDFDVVHYCGHGDFDPDDASRVGWLFAGGLLTAREIERIDQPPRLIVANACFSARTSARHSSGKQITTRVSDAELLPSIADEFFRRGVRDYIGTAWEVNDDGAILFAHELYARLLPPGSASGATIGEAVLAARQKLYAESATYDALWAAYQHYGEPTRRLVTSAR